VQPSPPAKYGTWPIGGRLMCRCFFLFLGWTPPCRESSRKIKTVQPQGLE
jgi:hypothetical protein